jgi:hypothetical protein
MTTKEFNEVVRIASRESDMPENIDCFWKFGLPEFKPVYVTLRQVAALIRYQAVQFNGEFDQEALQEVKDHGKRKFLII